MRTPLADREVSRLSRVWQAADSGSWYVEIDRISRSRRRSASHNMARVSEWEMDARCMSHVTHLAVRY